MNREFQARYLTKSGEVLSVNVVAEGDDQVTAELRKAGVKLLGITELRAVVDWDKPTFDLDEAAAFFNMKGATLSGLKLKLPGGVPYSEVNGRPIYIRSWLERLLMKNANQSARRLAAMSLKPNGRGGEI